MCFDSVAEARLWRFSATDMLPRDIMVDIFSRLPAKSVGRSRCVSKFWKSLLYDPNFIKIHLNRTKIESIDEVSILLCDKDSCKYLILGKPKYSVKLKLGYDQVVVAAANKLKFDDVNLPLFNSVINSCDGLVLLEDVEKDELWLTNPTTMEINKLPPSNIPVPEFDLLSMNYGIGYDASTDDYKVVSILFAGSIRINEMFVNIYSVKHGSWKRAEGGGSSPCCPYGYIFGSGFCVNGRIHWLDQNTSTTSYVVAIFDLEKESFHQMPVHGSFNPINKFRVTPLLGVLKGCLCLYYFRGEDNRGIDVWMMKEYGVPESWTKFHIKGRDDELSLTYLCLLTEQRLVMLRACGFNKRKEVVMYNMKEGGFKNVVLDGIPHNFTISQGHVFVECLVSPHPMNYGGGMTEALELERSTSGTKESRGNLYNLVQH